MREALDTWKVHDRINLYLLNGIDEESLCDRSASKGRTVGEQFAHIHNVRLMWLKAAKPALLTGLMKFEKGTNISKSILTGELINSGNATCQLLEHGFTTGKIKGFTPHPFAFLGYMISHESHHRGQIVLSLKQSGHPLNQKIQYGIWEWGSR